MVAGNIKPVCKNRSINVETACAASGFNVDFYHKLTLGPPGYVQRTGPPGRKSR